MSVISPNFDSIQSVLDTCKVSDSVVFLVSATRSLTSGVRLSSPPC